MLNDSVKDRMIRQRAFYNTVSNYIGKVIVLGAGFFMTPFILHRLGANTYGLWVLIGSVVAYGGLLDLGIANAVTKYIAEFQAKRQIEQAQSLVATALCLYTGLGLLAIVLTLILAPFFPDLFQVPAAQRTTAIWLVVLSGLSLGVSIPCTITAAILRGLQRFELNNLISILGTLCSTVATVLVLSLGGGILSVVLVNLVTTIIMQVPSVWLIHRIVPDLHFGWRAANRQLLRTVAAFSSSLFLANVAGHLQAKTDEVVIGAVVAVSTVAPYNFARRLSEIVQVLTEQFLKVLLPLASTLHAENDHARLRSLYLVSTRLTLVIFLPLGCVMVILARPILTAWVGGAYGNYAPLIFILTVAGFIDTSQWPASFVLQGMARHRPLAIMGICSGVVNLLLSVIFIHWIGIMGVAVGTLIPTTIECLFFVMPYAMRVTGVTLAEVVKEIVGPTLLPAVPTALILYLLRTLLQPASFFSILLIASVGILVYGVSYFCMGATPSERQIYHQTVCAAWARLKSLALRSPAKE